MIPSIIGVSQHIEKIKKLIQQIAEKEENVLVLGERGVGKDLVAQNLFLKSKRVGKPFLKINCPLVVGTELENEIFGPEPPHQNEFQVKKRGILERVKGGVIFLDKIDETPPALQTKFFQLLQSSNFTTPLDSYGAFKTDVWIIAAASGDLEIDVIEGRFRRDLFQYLSTKKILIEPLRKRPEDIPALIQHHMQRYAKHLNVQKIKGPKKKSIRRMADYHWPGNVKELQNIVKKIMIFGDTEQAYQYRNPFFDDDFIPSTDNLALFDITQYLSMSRSALV
jgi:DNA-binding NtrC family response regulator